ncbi:hypothetical protein CK623_06460 [Vandammella animalimorsus]|uniref:Uncharacterized protein n=2 Tax=Vandammella animalimorsus TaxID=2029117 RepID=A0A2A2ARI4_9BURK|nr:hypothetical protein CK623_06460 [Vandammella animalimorsus]
MNEQLQITAGYLPELNQFQAFTFTCVDSWIHLDLCQQEINIVEQKISAIVNTISLINAYMSELNKLSQHQARHAWREFTAARRLTVTNDFVDKSKDRIDRTSKSNHDEFKNELKRLQSHRNALYKEANSLRAERATLLKKKKILNQQHIANKNELTEKYEACIEHWRQIAKKFKVYYAFEVSDLSYVNEWLADLKEGGTLPEINRVIDTVNKLVDSAIKKFHELNNEYKPYNSRVKAAHESNEYPDTFAKDNAQRKRLAPMVKAAFEDKKALIDARSFFYTRRNELHGYINPLHPDAAIDAICEILSTDREFNTWLAFGINTRKQKRKHWEKKKYGIKNAAKN